MLDVLSKQAGVMVIYQANNKTGIRHWVTLRAPHLHGNHLHKDGEVCQMVTQADREGQVSISSHTALIGPHTLFGAKTDTHVHIQVKLSITVAGVIHCLYRKHMNSHPRPALMELPKSC